MNCRVIGFPLPPVDRKAKVGCAILNWTNLCFVVLDIQACRGYALCESRLGSVGSVFFGILEITRTLLLFDQAGVTLEQNKHRGKLRSETLVKLSIVAVRIRRRCIAQGLPELDSYANFWCRVMI